MRVLTATPPRLGRAAAGRRPGGSRPVSRWPVQRTSRTQQKAISPTSAAHPQRGHHGPAAGARGQQRRDQRQCDQHAEPGCRRPEPAGGDGGRHQRDDWLAAAMSGLTEIERQLLVLASGLMLRLADAPGTAPASGGAAADGAATADGSANALVSGLG
ncbi:hypothetical protein ABZY09_46560 [Streptomyces sp. NPDC002928]|uniref:hypothetical protein n=1 Tax=Streptomyces sp. NPDC002928 TaxID=3154440 RepID=UPI0033A82906